MILRKKVEVKYVLRVIVATILAPLLIIYLIANHFIEQKYRESLRFVILDFVVDLYSAWREIFGLK